jgi:HlyD family secretion protein
MTFLTAPSSPFRKAALDRLASPEQLDRMVTVTSARGWLALLVLCLLILAGLAWSIVGTLPTYARADGILLRKTGKVVANLAAGNGVLAEFLVKTGDPVTTGQVIARIDHREPMPSTNLR